MVVMATGIIAVGHNPVDPARPSPMAGLRDRTPVTRSALHDVDTARKILRSDPHIPDHGAAATHG
jgi:hypothetical protein